LTPTGHWPDRNPAAQQYRGYAIPFVQAREVLSSETTRFLHASWRRGRSRPIAEITALSRQKETSEGAESRAKISHWLCRASNVLQNQFTGTKPKSRYGRMNRRPGRSAAAALRCDATGGWPGRSRGRRGFRNIGPYSSSTCPIWRIPRLARERSIRCPKLLFLWVWSERTCGSSAGIRGLDSGAVVKNIPEPVNYLTITQ